MLDKKITESTQTESKGQAVSVLSKLAALEASLSLEVDRLSGPSRPVTVARSGIEYRGRPVWWWRMTLLSWVDTKRTRTTHAADVLQGLRVVLDEWDDGMLLGFLHQLPPSSSAA